MVASLSSNPTEGPPGSPTAPKMVEKKQKERKRGRKLEDIAESSAETEEHPLNESSSEFGELCSSEYISSSYLSFSEPTFSASIVISQPNFLDPTVQLMASSQNFQTFNYPVFKKYGYYIDGVYHSMAKKGATRLRTRALYRRGMPKLATIKEEPELEEKQNVLKNDKDMEKKIDVNMNNDINTI